jgi:uncharacterized protein YjiK
MLVTSRAIGLVVMLLMVPQAPRTALGRCTITEQPAAGYPVPGLAEISGLATGPRGTLLAHGDERGVVVVLDGATLERTRVVQLKGSPRDDFEGIAAADDSVALMTSTGRVYLFRLGPDSIVPFTMFGTGLGRACELEGLAWHRASATLFFPCKQPRGKGVSGLTVYRYRMGPTPAIVPPVQVSWQVLSRAAGVPELRATSIEIDQATGHLLVLSSKPPLIVEVDTTGRVLAGKRLSSRNHPQAEGLTMSRDALWISDEGRSRQGVLTKYACQ